MGGHGRRTHIEWHVVAAEWMRWPPRWTKSQETASSIQQHGSSSQQPAGRTSLNVNLIALFQPQITKRVLHKAANMSSLAPVSSSTRSSSRSRFSPRFSTLFSILPSPALERNLLSHSGYMEQSMHKWIYIIPKRTNIFFLTVQLQQWHPVCVCLWEVARLPAPVKRINCVWPN